MMRLARAAAQTGAWQVELVGSDTLPLPTGSPFTFAWYQGEIPAVAPSGPSHVRLTRRANPVSFELHLSLQWVGRSTATHECDVSMLPKSIADPMRNNGGGSPHGLPVAAFECKDRGTTGNTDEMRQTLARLFDLALVTTAYPRWGCRLFEPHNHTRWGRYRTRYREFFKAGHFAIVRSKKFSTGADSPGDHYKIERHGDVYTDGRVIQALEKSFTDLLRRIDDV